jgi:hypothetical protein
MIGANQLNLNAATMMQALQEWIDKRWAAPAPKVVSINVSNHSYSGEIYCVGVEVQETKTGNQTA